MSSVIDGIPQADPRNPTLPEITDGQIQLHHSTGHDLKKWDRSIAPARSGTEVKHPHP